jgi:hypothetical protein
MKKRDKDKQLNVIRQPKLNRILWNCTATVMFLVSIYFVAIKPINEASGYTNLARIAVFILFFGLTLLCFVASQVFWKIEICEAEFIYRDMLGICKKYKYSEVAVKRKNFRSDFFFHGECIVSIEHNQKNYDALENAIFEHRHRERQKNKELGIWNNKTKPNLRTNIIRYAKHYTYMGAIFMLVILPYAAFMIVKLYPDIDVLAEMTILALMCPYFIWCIFAGLNWKVEIERDYFVYYSAFKKRKVYNYSDITVKYWDRTTFFYYKRKYILRISPINQTNSEALEHAIDLYQKRQLRKSQMNMDAEETAENSDVDQTTNKF